MLEMSQRWFRVHRREWVGISKPFIHAYKGYELPQILTLDGDLGTNLPKTLKMTIFNNRQPSY